MAEKILEVKNLKKHFVLEKGFLNKKKKIIKAVNDISFSINKGEIFGLVGESGSGKSTVGNCIVGLYKPSSGKICYKSERIENIGLQDKEAEKYRDGIQMVFQDPTSSLNPRRTVKQILEVPLKKYRQIKGRKNLDREIEKLVKQVELSPGNIKKFPRSLSGGQKQRVSIARVLACDPEFIVLDEPTSALDVSVQAKVIKILNELRRNMDLSYLFITHDLSLMRNIANQVMVMYLGQACELADNESLYKNPSHPYTRTLLSAIPVVSAEEEKLKPKDTEVEGEIPNPSNIPEGCSFHNRCDKAFAKCSQLEPEFIEIEPGHFVKCHLYNKKG